MTIQLSSTGEIGVFRDVDQMQPQKTQFGCGYFSGAILKAMGPVGSTPTQSIQAMITEALGWYTADHGNDLISNTDGMTLDEEYNLIVNKMGLHYQASSLSLADIRAWVSYGGMPIMLTIAELSVEDLVLGRNPYPWTPAGNHIIVLTGIASDGNFLVRDPANCTNLYDPNSLRPGPRKYKASALQIINATVVVPTWRSRPTSATPPTASAAEGDDTMLNITDSFASAHFKQTSTNPLTWHCVSTGVDLTGAILTFYRQIGGGCRLPTKTVQQHPTLAGVSYVECEAGIIVDDPGGKLDKPSGFQPCYLLKLTDPLAKTLVGGTSPSTATIAAATAQLGTATTAITAAEADLKEG